MVGERLAASLDPAQVPRAVSEVPVAHRLAGLLAPGSACQRLALVVASLGLVAAPVLAATREPEPDERDDDGVASLHIRMMAADRIRREPNPGGPSLEVRSQSVRDQAADTIPRGR